MSAVLKWTMRVAGSQRMRSKPLVTGECHKAVILPSVVGIVRSGSPTPGAVLEAANAEIRRREAEAVAKPEPTKLKPGAIVRIQEGPSTIGSAFAPAFEPPQLWCFCRCSEPSVRSVSTPARSRRYEATRFVAHAYRRDCFRLLRLGDPSLGTVFY